MALSPLQEGLYSLTALAEFAEDEPADDPYVIGMAADISGALDVALLRDCAATMLTRHPNLRASFFSRGIARPVQIVPSRVELPWRDVTAAAEDVEALEADERRRPFDLERRTGDPFPAHRIARCAMAFGDHRASHRDRRLVAAGVRHRDDRSSTGPAAIQLRCRLRHVPTATTSAGLRAAIRKPANGSGVSTSPGLPGPTLLSAAFGGEDTARQPFRLPHRTELRLDVADTAAAGRRVPAHAASR